MKDPAKTSLSGALTRFAELAETRDHSLGEMFEAVDDKGFGVLLILLALPSALPVPAAGYSTPFGLAILVLGAQMLAGRHTPWLPRQARDMKLPRGLFVKMIAAGRRFLGLTERFIRPRLRWIAQPNGRRALALMVMAMAALMCLPIPGTNTFPAMVIFLVGVGLSEEDGLFAVLAALAAVFAIALYAAAIYFLIRFFQDYGWDAIDVFLDKIKEFVKNLL